VLGQPASARANPDVAVKLRFTELVRRYFGEGQQAACALIHLAQAFISVGDPDSAQKCCTDALNFFSHKNASLCPLEVIIALAYTTGRVHQEKKSLDKAYAYYTAALNSLQMLTGSVEKVIEDESELYYPAKPLWQSTAIIRRREQQTEAMAHPFLLLLLNRVVEVSWRLHGRARENLCLYRSHRFLALWKAIPFRGNKKLREKLFGHGTPLPFSIMLEHRGDWKLAKLLGDHDLDDTGTRAWISAGALVRSPSS
jgi:hypothetical protein